MKKVFRSVLIVFAILFANHNLSYAQTNLLLNPGFEEGLASWEPYSGLNDGSQVSIDSNGGYTGANLLAITTPAAFASGEGGAGVGQNGVPCKAGNYTYSAWIKGDSTFIGVILKGLDAEGVEFIRWVGGTDWGTKANPDTWEQISYTFDVAANPGETNLNVRLFIYSTKQSAGTMVLIDDASLVRNNLVPPVNPNNLIVNPGFEEGLAPWEPYSGFNDGTHVSIDSTGGYTGANLLAITTPAAFASGEGGAGVGQNGVPCKAGNYTYSAWVKGDSTFIGVILKGLDAQGAEFVRWVGGTDWGTKANPEVWEQISYNFDVAANPGEINLNVRLFIYSTKQSAGTMVLIDDVSLVRNNLVPPVDPNNLIVNPGFEEGLAPWEPYSGFNDGTHASLDSTGGFTGANLLVITTPAAFASGEGGAGVGQNGIPCVEGNYTYSAWMKGDSTYLGVILKGLDSEGYEFIRWVGGSDAATKVNPDNWEKVTYTCDIVAEEGETDLNLRLFIYSIKQNPGSKVLIDDASLVKNRITIPPVIDPNNLIVDNPGFEEGIGIWSSNGGEIAIDSLESYTGINSLLIHTPADFGAGAALADIPCVRGNYTFSVWIKGDSSYIFPLLYGFDQNGDPLETYWGGETDWALTNADSWVKVTYTFDVNPEEGATNLSLKLIVQTKKVAADTKVLADDVSLIINYATGIPNFDKDLIKLYPNPVVDQLNICLVSANSEVSIYTASGKLISKNTFSNTTGTIDVSGLAKGVYILKVNNNYVQKFVK